jgi:signal transducing adaptor molecule
MNVFTKAPSPVRQNPPPQPSYLFQVKALYDFNPTDSGELQLRKGDIVNVYDHTTFPDWWKGSLNGNLGIFPSNYVERIEQSEPRSSEAQDEIGTVLQKAKLIRQLKEGISRADPLGHDYAENERLQQEYQVVVGLVPEVIKLANAKRKEQDELSALYERFSQACNSYQQLMSDFAAHQASQVQQPGIVWLS